MAVSYEWKIARENMRSLRVKSKMSQIDLGKELGVSGSTICYYEKGRGLPSIDYVEAFCIFFGIGIDDLYEPDLVKGVLHL